MRPLTGTPGGRAGSQSDAERLPGARSAAVFRRRTGRGGPDLVLGPAGRPLVPLQLYQGDKPVTLEARTDGGYLLHMGSREVTYQDTTPAGESYTNTMQVPCYAMIASQDLREGRADLIEIRDEVYG